MAHDEGLAELIRGELADVPDVAEIRMFGGLCFTVAGHMAVGVHGAARGGAMARVGKAAMEAALALPGTRVMTMGARRFDGYVDATGETLADDGHRRRLVAMALDFVRTLPPKG